MQEVFHEAVNRLEKGEPVVVATVIRTKGSTPQKPGAKLLVRQDGTGAGTLGGGCVEGDIWFAAKQLMRECGEAEYREYELNEELAAEDGLVCGGTMYFLIDPVYTPEDYLPYAREIDCAYKGEGAVALATVIKSGSDGKSRIGDKLFIRENGETEGTLGNLDTDKGAIEKAKVLMIHGRNEYVMTASGAEYFVEAYTTPPQLVICGGGHVSRALASLAKPLEFRLFITDDREEFANEERFPEADIVVSEKPENALPNLPINPNTFIVVATRGHRYDNTALLAAAKTPARYVGLMGSKRKTILIYEDLMRSDLSLDRIREIRSPIGLDIKARTPEEIAISIMSEVLMFRLGGSGLPMKLDEKQLERIKKKISEEDDITKVTPVEAV
ncbi:MAG: XdhC family protein [Chloroflexota bacterium]|jgi:xanthine dehydrogenase accessory factor|nr:XdhC family protein [Chloroflexota bacterium]